MTDLVERLRAMSRCEHDDLSIGDEAADEIEKLREALKDAEKTISRNNTLIGKMAVAIRRLKGAKTG